MEAVQVETGGIQTEADKVDIIDIQTEAGKVEISGIQTEAGKVETSGVLTEADKVEISGIQTEDDKVEISDIQTEAAKVEIGDIQMEADKVEIGGLGDKTIETSQALANPSAQEEHFDSPKTEPIEASSSKKRKFEASTEDSLAEYILPVPGGTNCYPFKMRLQAYCDKAGLTCLYETIIEGPSHEPSYRSTVIVDNVRYDSLPGFSNRKVAEHSAAEVALRELANSVDTVLGTSKSLHETGMCFILLLEYAQKMNYAIPLYECQQEERKGKTPIFSCVVTIGGIKYAGASATTKKEAKIKAARTAMLAIQSAAASSSPEIQTPVNSVYAVIPPPPKKEVPTAAADELSKRRLKNLKRKQKKMEASKTCTLAEGTTCSEAGTDSQKKEGPTAKAKPSRRILNKLRLEKRRQALETGTSGEGTTTCLEVNSESQLKIGATTSGEGTTPSEVVNADSQDILPVQSPAPLPESQTVNSVKPVIEQEEKVLEVVFRNMGPTTEARTKRNRVKAENRKKKKKEKALKDGTSIEGTTSLEANDVGGPLPPTAAIKPIKRDFKNQDWKKKRQLFKNYTSRAAGPPWMQPRRYLDRDFIPMTSQHHHHYQRETQQPMGMHDGVRYHHMDERETGYVTYPYVPPPANTIYQNYY